MNQITNDFGDYSRQIIIEVNGHRIQCDWELASEIAKLNLRGIKTVASCAGHGQKTRWIAVSPDHEKDMIELGYVRYANEHGAVVFVAGYTAKVIVEEDEDWIYMTCSHCERLLMDGDTDGYEWSGCVGNYCQFCGAKFEDEVKQ